MKKLIFALLLFVFFLFLGEQYFKKKFIPGYQTHYSGFNVVDSLIIYQDYQSDSFGNYVLSYLVRDSLKVIYDQAICDFTNKKIENSIASVDGIKEILKEFCTLKKQQLNQTEFEKYYTTIKGKELQSKSDSSFIDYVNFPFNSMGFRSIAFENYPSEKKKILVIGDSFVWGMKAQPYYNSFADILLARNYQVFNAGIPSVDPIQYLSICKNYVDLIQPDLVIINFFEGNDIMNVKRVHSPNTPHEHITNAGFFESNPEGTYLNAQETYNYYENKLRIPDNNLWNKLLGKTAIGSILWTQTHPKERYHFESFLNTEQSIEYTKVYIDSISALLDAKEINYFFAITPNESAGYNSTSETLSFDSLAIGLIFNNLEHYMPSNFSHEDYSQPQDFHFNNIGSLKYANFIDSLIQRKLKLE